MEGPLHLDLFQQPKLLINGVALGIRLHHARNPFRILSNKKDNPDFKVRIVDATFKVCVQKLNSAIYLAQEKLIQESPAIYPYLRSEIKTTAIAAGQYSYSVDNIFQDTIPAKLIVGLVSSSACSGDYSKNPFKFKHFDCNHVGFYIDGQSIPTQPLHPNYAGDQYVDSYRTLAIYRSDITVSQTDYKQGYCLYALDIDPHQTFNTKRKGNCRLELKFAKPLPESVTLILYGSFPEALIVDKSRAVYVK